jgi:integrase
MPKETTRLEYQELKQRLNDIPQTDHKILLKLIYATCGRVGEIVNARYSTYKGEAFNRKNISWSYNLLTLNVITEKTQEERIIPIGRVDNPGEMYFKKGEDWLTEDLIRFAESHDVDKPFFGFSTRWAEKVFCKYFPEHKQHIHLLRKWRATHLLSGEATGVPLPTPFVMRIGGWTDERTLSKIYNSTVVGDYVKMK